MLRGSGNRCRESDVAAPGRRRDLQGHATACAARTNRIERRAASAVY